LTTILVAAGGFIASLLVSRTKEGRAAKPFPWMGPVASLRDLREICSERNFFVAIVSDAWFYFIASFTVLTINSLGLGVLGFSQTGTSLLSVCLMAGVCAGSFLVARQVDLSNWSAGLVRAAAGIGAGLLLAGLTVLLPVTWQFAWLSGSLLISGIAGGMFLIPVTSFLQVRPADSEKGRVLAAAGFSSFVAILISGLLFNLLDALLSPHVLLMTSGAAGFVMAFLLLALIPGTSIITKLSAMLLRRLLALRYRISTTGLEKITRENAKGILFLPNHPALIDPVIVMSLLYSRFAPRPLSEATQVDKPFIRSLIRPVRPILLPQVGKNGLNNREQVLRAVDKVVESLREGDNVLFYPAGRLTHTGREDLAGKLGVEYIVRQIPDLQIVLVRTTGLWGSSFSRAAGTPPSLFGRTTTYLLALMANALFFVPKREVTVEFVSDHAITTLADRTAINNYLESHYNTQPVTRIDVPFFRWQGKTSQKPVTENSMQKTVSASCIPASIRLQVELKLKEMCGTGVAENEHLAGDLGLDSLSIMELSAWLEQEFGCQISDPGVLATVGDCIHAAGGKIFHRDETLATPPPKKWWAPSAALTPISTGSTSITEAFLQQARRHSGKVIIADRISGAKTYRDILTAIFALIPILETHKGKRIGIMLPASVSSGIVYLATLFSGKTPVMFNWTAGYANIDHGIGETGVDVIVSATPLCKKVEEQQGVRLDRLPVRWLHLDKLLPKLGLIEKGKALVKARCLASTLFHRTVPEEAAILFTSGSESRPKAVPLTHANILANLADFTSAVQFDENTRLLGILPPFHSLGLAGTIILPLCLGIPTVYHANPTESLTLVRLIETYKATMLISTPTFLGSILQAGNREQLGSLQLVFTGAEKCPEHVMATLRSINPQSELCEGYGITECSPLVSLNIPGDNKPGTIGRVLPSMEYAIVDDGIKRRVTRGERGLLLVRGPNIFRGYLNQDRAKGFCRFAGKTWYQTGDYVREDEARRLVFSGRKKRFVKIGGEMISLPAIEDVLLSRYIDNTISEGPMLAVDATDHESHPEIVLFTKEILDQSAINGHLRQAGLSPLHNIRRVIQVASIPVLGSGKTDYQQLKKLLVHEPDKLFAGINPRLIDQDTQVKDRLACTDEKRVTAEVT
ncbi:MAG: AMP-binding protein, partial [Desulforhopalus sp.]